MKAQVKMFETVGVLVVFFMIMSLGFVFYFFVFEHTSTGETERQLALHNIQTVHTALSLPELECSVGKSRKRGCIDKQKAASFSVLMSNEDILMDYFPILKFSKVSLEVIYPPSNAFNLTIYDHKMNSSSFAHTTVPIRVYDIIDKQFNYGVLRVKRYEG